LWVECGPCVVNGNGGLGNGFPSSLYEEIMDKWENDCIRKEIAMQGRMWGLWDFVFFFNLHLEW
jgi:hypothetical protein